MSDNNLPASNSHQYALKTVSFVKHEKLKENVETANKADKKKDSMMSSLIKEDKETILTEEFVFNKLEPHIKMDTSEIIDKYGIKYELESAKSANSSLNIPHDFASVVSINIPVLDMFVIDSKNKTLSEFESITICSVLQETVDYLETIKYTLKGNKNLRINNNYRTVDEKYGHREEQRYIFSEKMGLPPLTLNNSEKLIRDTNYLIDIFNKTVLEIQQTGKFKSLEEEVNRIQDLRFQERNLEENYKMWLEVYENTNELIRSNKIIHAKEIEELSEEIKVKKAQLSSMKFKSVTKIEYYKKSEDSRIEVQHLLVLREENKLQEDIMTYMKIEENEVIIYEKLTEYLQKYIQDTKNQIQVWSKNYNEDFERLQQDIVYLQEDIENHKKEIHELTLIRDKRQAFINECIVKREKIRIKQDHLKLLHTSATIIQSVWRGYMVRHRLGHFEKLWANLKNKKKGKGKKTKSKKKVKK